jgi:hypothetical protein
LYRMTKKKSLVVIYLKNSDPSELLLISMMWKQMYNIDMPNMFSLKRIQL